MHSQLPQQAEILAAAEALAVRTLDGLSDGCEQTKVLSGTTTRGPAFVYLCTRGADISVISIPAGGLRQRDPGDPTSRTRIATFPLAGILCETGAFIESDGTVRATLTLHLPGQAEPEWEVTVDDPASVGRAMRTIHDLRTRHR